MHRYYNGQGRERKVLQARKDLATKGTFAPSWVEERTEMARSSKGFYAKLLR
jgi:hypothetical protein